MRTRRLGAAGVVIALAGAGLLVTAPNATASTITVSVGQSIQSAVNAAHPGDTIRIGPGVFHEVVSVGTSNLTIVGNGTIIAPPPGPVWGLCVANNASNCTSSGPVVKNVTISGITVRDERSWAFAAIGGSNITFDHDTAINDGVGFSVDRDAWTTVSNAVINGTGTGVLDRASFDTKVSSLVARNNTYGIVVNDADGFTVKQSVLQSNCAGMVIAAGSGQNAPVTVSGNAFTHNTSSCTDQTGFIPPIDGVGVAVIDSDHVALSGNGFQGNGQISPAGLYSGGLIVAPTSSLAGNAFVANAFSADAPYDIATDDVIPADNRFANNACRTSAPTGLCV